MLILSDVSNIIRTISCVIGLGVILYTRKRDIRLCAQAMPTSMCVVSEQRRHRQQAKKIIPSISNLIDAYSFILTEWCFIRSKPTRPSRLKASIKNGLKIERINDSIS